MQSSFHHKVLNPSKSLCELSIYSKFLLKCTSQTTQVSLDLDKWLQKTYICIGLEILYPEWLSKLLPDVIVNNSITYNKWKIESIQISTGEWTICSLPNNNIVYDDVKKQTHVSTWKNLKNFMLSEKSQMEQATHSTYCMHSQKRQEN